MPIHLIRHNLLLCIPVQFGLLDPDPALLCSQLRAGELNKAAQSTCVRRCMPEMDEQRAWDSWAELSG